MERKWYKWENGMWQEAPATVTGDDYTLYNYNSEANEAMLRADGYLPESEIDVIGLTSEANMTIDERLEITESKVITLEEIINTLFT